MHAILESLYSRFSSQIQKILISTSPSEETKIEVVLREPAQIPSLPQPYLGMLETILNSFPTKALCDHSTAQMMIDSLSSTARFLSTSRLRINPEYTIKYSQLLFYLAITYGVVGNRIRQCWFLREAGRTLPKSSKLEKALAEKRNLLKVKIQINLAKSYSLFGKYSQSRNLIHIVKRYLEAHDRYHSSSKLKEQYARTLKTYGEMEIDEIKSSREIKAAEITQVIVLLYQAAEIFEEFHDNLAIARITMYLARAYIALAETSTAIAASIYLDSATKSIQQSILLYSQPEVSEKLIALRELAGILSLKNRHSEAIRMIQAILAKQENFYAKKHEDCRATLACTKLYLSNICLRAKKYEDAGTSVEKATAELQSSLGPHSPLVQKAENLEESIIQENFLANISHQP